MKIGELTKDIALSLPLFSSRVKAGFPSPADDFVERKLDLNDFLVDHPASTFFVKVQGDSMMNAGIDEGDILIVDKSLEAKNHDIIIACLNSEFTVKTYVKDVAGIWLVPANNRFKPILINEESNFEIWGVVTYCIKKVS